MPPSQLVQAVHAPVIGGQPLPPWSATFMAAVLLTAWPVFLLLWFRRFGKRRESGPVAEGETTSRHLRVADDDLPVPTYRSFDADAARPFGGPAHAYAVDPDTRLPYFDTRDGAEGIAKTLKFAEPVIEQWNGECWTGPRGDIRPMRKGDVYSMLAIIAIAPPLVAFLLIWGVA